MKLYYIIGLLCSMTLSGSVFAEEETVPNVVQIEGMSEMLSLLKHIDQGISRLTASRWEYRFVQRNRLNNDLKEQITAMGHDGWELVNATVQEGFIIKRRVPHS